MGVVVDSYDNIILTGVFSEYIDFGGGRLSGNYISSPTDAFIAKFSPAGDHLWSRAHGNYPNGVTMQAAVDSGNNVIAAGIFSDTVNFGGDQLTSAGAADIFLVKYSPTGSHLWSRRFGSTGSDAGNAMESTAVATY